MTKSDSKKHSNEKPISLHPLTVEEALRKAMNEPAADDDAKSKTSKKRKKAKKK